MYNKTQSYRVMNTIYTMYIYIYIGYRLIPSKIYFLRQLYHKHNIIYYKSLYYYNKSQYIQLLMIINHLQLASVVKVNFGPCLHN